MKGALTVSANIERGGFDPLQRPSTVAVRCRRQHYGNNVLSRPPTDAAVKSSRRLHGHVMFLEYESYIDAERDTLQAVMKKVPKFFEEYRLVIDLVA